MPIHTKYDMFVHATAVPTAGAWIPLDRFASPFNVSIAGIVGSAGSGVYRVEHTFNDVMRDSSNATAFVHVDLSAQSNNADGNYAFPVAATRLVVVSAASAQTVSLIVTQSGI